MGTIVHPLKLVEDGLTYDEAKRLLGMDDEEFSTFLAVYGQMAAGRFTYAKLQLMKQFLEGYQEIMATILDVMRTGNDAARLSAVKMLLDLEQKLAPRTEMPDDIVGAPTLIDLSSDHQKGSSSGSSEAS